MGRNQDPITLHKYLYAHSDPGNITDPSGQFGVGAILRVQAALFAGYGAAVSYQTIYGGNSQANDAFGAEFNSDRKWSLWDILASSIFRAKVTAESTTTSGSTRRRSPQGHHTIPIYLCGAQNQQLSYLEQPDHVAVHAGLAAVEVALHKAEEAADIKVPFTRRRTPEVLSLAETSQGRGVIASAIELYYSGAGWWSKGSPTIGSVFSKEKFEYVRGKTSLPNCKRSR